MSDLRRDLGLPDRPGATGRASDGIWTLLVQQLLISVTALAIAMVHRRCRSPCGSDTSAGAASWRSTSPTSAGRCRPSRCSRSWSPLDHPGVTTFGPYGRAGLATLIALSLFALPPIITNAYVAVRRGPGRGQGGRPTAWA